MTITIAVVLLSFPIALLSERLIWQLTDNPVGGNEPSSLVQLGWQVEPWSTRLRLATALLAPPLGIGAALRFDGAEAVVVYVLILALLVCSATDLLRYRVPNVITYPGVWLALAAALLMPEGDFAGAGAAAVLSSGIFLAIWALSGGGIGLADVKLAVLIGAALGLPGAYHALALGVIAGGAVIATLLALGTVNRRQVTPYAPFLAISAVVVTFAEGTAFATV